MRPIARSLLIFLIVSFVFHPGVSAEDKLEKAPKLPKRGIWLNATKDHKPTYKDKVTLVYFWDYTSVNCLRELGLLKRWYQQYRPYGFQMVWIHAPEFDFAHKARHVERALKWFQIPYPVYLDNDFKLWEDFKNRSWPTKHLVNSEGHILHSFTGEGDYLLFEKAIQDALTELDHRTVLPDPVVKVDIDRFNTEECGWMTGETYIGHKRAGWWGGQIANKKWMKPGQTARFKDRGERVERGFFVEGVWSNQADAFVHERETHDLTDYLGVIYMAREVYVVANQQNEDQMSRIYLTYDDRPVPELHRGLDVKVDLLGQTYFELNHPRLYYLIKNGDDRAHELRLWSSREGDAINSFSFANQCLSEIDFLI